MMNLTHVALSACITSIALSTADPVTLGISALASQFPDVDTSKSVIGRVLFPISNYIEARYPHRSITHSFVATGAIALLSLPLVILGSSYWLALALGYFCGWFGDVFTKSGVTAFYPSQARLVIPGNPRLRLSTGSRAEYLVLVLIAIACLISINITSSGGILRAFNQVLAMPSGAVEITNEEINRNILIAQVRGRNALTQAPVVGDYEIVKS
ncbi:metal-dependent hydrolase, partial [Merismopedia glauca]|uniref:metal-dependent hydrolase n=1 Tax=Merismopedia glauca TaxID=292586 RepID=UPI001C631934